MRALLTKCLGELPGHLVVLSGAADVETLRTAAEVPAPDLVLIGWWEGSAFPCGELLAAVKECWPAALVLALCPNFAPGLVQGAVRAGCQGLLCPHSSSFALVCEALHHLYTGGTWYPAEAVAALAQPPPPEGERERIERLCSHIQQRILNGVCAADEPTWVQVAERNHLSLCTVEWHYPRLYKLLRVKGKAGLVALGRRNGFGQG